MIKQSEILSPSQVQFITSFLEVYNSVAPFTSHGKLHEFGAEKQISWANRHILSFSQYTLLSGVTYWALVEMLLRTYTHMKLHN